MNSIIHERPGVYSSYDASSVLGTLDAVKVVGVAARSVQGTANEVVSLTSYEEGKEHFGADAEDTPGMSTLLRVLFLNGAGTVKAVRVDGDDYATAFAALEEEEDTALIVCDSTDVSVHQSLRESVERAAALRRERIGLVGSAEESVSALVNHAREINSERMVLIAPNVVLSDGTEASAAFAAAAVAGLLSTGGDASAPVNGATLYGLGGVKKRWNDSEIDLLVRGGVTALECVGGVCSPVRGVTTKTTSGGAADTTWRELTTILIVDEVIPTIRAALRARFARSRNTAQTRGAIRSQVVLELEEMRSRELIDSYGEVQVSALGSDATVCLVEFSFTVAHGLNRIYLTAHITV